MSHSDEKLKNIPTLGSGIGYRAELHDVLLARKEQVDFVEIIADQFIPPSKRKELHRLCDEFTVIPHGIGLSVGSSGRLDPVYLEQIKQISDCTRSPYYSEHLCMTRSPGIDIGHLSPLWLTHDTYQTVRRHVEQVQDHLKKPLILENVTYLFELPGSQIRLSQFLSDLTDATGCGLLVDVTNVYTNSVNHDFSAVQFLESLPLHSIVQTHLAGGYWSDGILVDSHSGLVEDASWQLLRFLTEKASIKASIIEHDSDFPDDLGILIEQVSRARELITSKA